MIVGILLRNYKVYEGISFIPISTSTDDKYSVYIGENGVGKSSILEALNAFFTNGVWNINKKGKRSDAFVAPIFLIKKDTIKLNKNESNFLDKISNYFWSISEKANPNFSKISSLKAFLHFRDNLKTENNPNEFYFFLIGTQHTAPNKVFFSTFHDDLMKFLEKESIKEDDLKHLRNIIFDNYSFIYVPVESSINDILKLEANEMKEFMNKDVSDTIEKVLQDKVIPGKKDGKISTLKYINDSLDEFMDIINPSIQKIDSHYKYKKNLYAKNLRASDVRDKILDAFFSTRTLKKDGKEIGELSSGEQRVALIDIAYAFLTAGDKKKKIILAIDEPEASLHMSLCFKQFTRIAELANKYNHQVIITTHWYGFLPSTQKGKLHHIKNITKPDIKSFNFSNYLEDRKKFPEDVEMKSFFDLVPSVIGSMKSEQTNWLICEGSDDKIYLEHYLKDNISNLFILPLGGVGNVIKLFNFLLPPLVDKVEKKSMKSKIFCLIDTDRIKQTCAEHSLNKERYLCIRRLQLKGDGLVGLSRLNSDGDYDQTDIEDCVNPETLYLALSTVINSSGNELFKHIFDMFEFNAEAKSSRIEGEESILKPKTLDALAKKKTLYPFINRNDVKYQLAKTYVELDQISSPIWIGEIVKFYKA